ncbi:MAG TPA: 4-alpha-glucanotransferase [Pyrinomonadaceae bacterium]|nr:4-alpha-glucanotransferase [Pyrinomonadaceae bacterium]
MKFPRASGVLLHPTSLPGPFGIGDLGPEAHSFVDFLERAGQSVWQVLPLGPTGHGNSPYQCFSAFAGNTVLISPELLVEEGILDASHLAERPAFNSAMVDFGAVYEWHSAFLLLAFQEFMQGSYRELRSDLEIFLRENAWWLNDYSLYRALKAAQHDRAWNDWPEPLRSRHPEALDANQRVLSEQIEREKFYQFLFFRQWGQLKKYANTHGISIVGDVPIFVAHDSSDVWCNQDKFKLNPDGTPKVVAGVPPDYFSKTGQLWGNPIYDWEAMRADGFRWWSARVAFTLHLVDAARVDHFRGFSAAWEVPGGEETAVNGSWVEVPGHDLFRTLRQTLGELPLIAEDLGVITSDVIALRDAYGLPGMKILQFAFGGDARNHDLPHNYVRHCVAYTGTHDNDTVVGWWRSLRGSSKNEKEHFATVREHCKRYLATTGREIHWDFIRAVWASVADIAIAPLQDLLGLGSEARMNLPATEKGNWSWRFNKGDLTDEIADRLRELTEIYGRINRDRSGT